MIGNIKHFRFWCQKVIPLVYDNSLSYYEVLCKVVHYLNHVIEDINEIPEYIDEKVKEAIDDEHLKELISEVFRTLEDAISNNNEGENTHFSKDYPNLGTLVWHDNKLYETIRKIDQGDEILSGVNIKLVNFGDMFNDFIDEVKQNFTPYDDGLRETTSMTRPVHQLVWLDDILYEVVKPIQEGNAYIYTGDNTNVVEVSVDYLYNYILGLIADEASTRASEDARIELELGDLIASEVRTRESEDARIELELGDLIASEVSARESEDARIELELGDLIASEVNARISADNAIEAEIQEIIMNYPIVTPEMYGAVGDGVADDTEAVQAALTNGQKILCRNVYRITSTLFVDGAKSIFGDGTFHLYFDTPVDQWSFFLVLGGTSMGVSGETFSGEIDGFNVIAHGGRFNYVIGGTNAQDTVIRNCTFDFSASNCTNKIIFFGDNANVAQDYGSKSNYLIDNNRFIFNNVVGNTVNQCEPIGCAWRNEINVTNNTTFYAKDDLGFHGCKNVKVANNTMNDNFTSRIFFSNCQDVEIVNNIIKEHNQYLTQGIQLDQESGYTSLPPANFVIANNIIDYSGNTLDTWNYGIRICGWKRGVVANNALISFTEKYGRIFIENSGPFEGYDDLRWAEDIVVTGNRCSAIVHGLAGESASSSITPIIVTGNSVWYSLALQSWFDISSGNNLLASNAYFLVAQNPAHLVTNISFSTTSISGSYTNMTCEGLPTFKAKERYYVVGQMIGGATPNANIGTVTFNVLVNGVSKGTVDITSNGASVSMSSFVLEFNQDLSVQVKQSGGSTLSNAGLKLKLIPASNC